MTECSDSWLQLAGIGRGPVIGVLADYCIVSSKAKKTIESPKQAAETHITHTHTHDRKNTQLAEIKHKTCRNPQHTAQQKKHRKHKNDQDNNNTETETKHDNMDTNKGNTTTQQHRK